MTRLFFSRIWNILRKHEHDHNKASGFSWPASSGSITTSLAWRGGSLSSQWCSLFFYYITQCLYQFHQHVVCSVKLTSNQRSTTVTCRKNNNDRFDLCGKERQSYLSHFPPWLLCHQHSEQMEPAGQCRTSSCLLNLPPGTGDPCRRELPAGQLMLGGLVRHRPESQ